jgi:hypothetical protein
MGDATDDVSLVGCGFFEDNDDDNAAEQLVEVGGAGVKGPLAGAVVNLYLADLSQSDLKGDQQGDPGSTVANASIQDLIVPNDISGLVLLEFVVDADTTDLTTGAAPIFDNLITLVDAQRVIDGDDIYASVLTTMVVNLARQKADSGTPYSGDGNGTITEAEMIAALDVAQNQVKSTLGFGLDSETDIFTTPPLITNDTTSAEDQADVAAYRQAIEAVAAIANAVSEAGGGASAQDAFEALTEDLSDGDIDGQGSDGAIANLATVTTLTDIVTQDVTSLTIPGTETTVGDIESILDDETDETGSTADTTDLGNGNLTVDPEPAVVEVDSDADGVVDSEDAFPTDADNQTDADQDGFGDETDDAFPQDADNHTDADMDGFGDETDDAFPDDADNYSDADEDGFGDQTDDAFPDDPDNQTDADMDGFGDETDDAFPNDILNWTDADMDGLGDETLDEFLNDTDNDGIINEEDDFPDVPNDSDNDGVADDTDNCVDVFNPDQANEDGDAAGDACDGLPSAIWDQFEWDEAVWQDTAQF